VQRCTEQGTKTVKIHRRLSARYLPAHRRKKGEKTGELWRRAAQSIFPGKKRKERGPADLPCQTNLCLNLPLANKDKAEGKKNVENEVDIKIQESAGRGRKWTLKLGKKEKEGRGGKKPRHNLSRTQRKCCADDRPQSEFLLGKK